jgi:hypothetical protein
VSSGHGPRRLPGAAAQAPGTSCPGPAGVPLAACDVLWGWARPGQGQVTWLRGSLADSYDRAARFGGTWLLVSSYPISAYRRVMAATEAAEEMNHHDHPLCCPAP